MTLGNQELAVIDVTPMDMVVRREASVVLAEAQKVARELHGVISSKAHKVMFGGEQYLEFEDWTTCARFYGITAKVVSVEFVRYGDIAGFKAVAQALRSDGYVLSEATSACLNDEEKWRSKPKYDRQIHIQGGAWVTEPVDEAAHPKSTWVWQESPRRPESRRVKVGDEPVPLFQVMSMAETRACGKVLRQVLSWVVVLAGYRPTPAEELDTERQPVAEGQVVPHTAPAAGQAAPPRAQAPQASQPPPNVAATPQAQPTATAASGVTTVKRVQTKNGKSAKGPWTRYFVQFDDGREGVTFSDTLGQQMQVSATSDPKAPVNPHIEKTEKGHDLKGLLPLVAPPAAQPEPVHEPDEPVAGPEKILTVRKLTTDKGDRWAIQTDKRELFTDKAVHADEAVAARKAGHGLTPEFDVVKAPSGKEANWLKRLVAPPDAPHEVSATSDVPDAPGGREPGEDG